MTYFSIISTSIKRKPMRTLFTWLSVVVAFALFGLMIGLNASFKHLVEIARLDRIYVNARFGGLLPVTYRTQIARVAGVSHVAFYSVVNGYYKTTQNNVGVMMVDDNMEHVWQEPLTPPQFENLRRTRDGVFISRSLATRLNVGSEGIFPLLTRNVTRADGAKLWPYRVLGVVDDLPDMPAGFLIGNYSYLDQARLTNKRGLVGEFDVIVSNPSKSVEVSRAIDRLFSNSATPTRTTPEVIAAQSGAETAFNIGFVTQSVAGAGVLMILFVTGNALAQSVRERTKEFATMRTIGFSQASIIIIVLIEAIFLCLSGSAVGLMIARAASPWLQRFVPIGWAIPPPSFSIFVVSIAITCAIFVGIVSAVPPCVRIGRLNIASALSGKR